MDRKLVIAFWIVAAIWVSAGTAWAWPVPDTGQIRRSWSGSLIPCLLPTEQFDGPDGCGGVNSNPDLFAPLVASAGLVGRLNKVIVDPPLPVEYDLRDFNLITPVKDQNGKKADGTSDLGSTVGLCWAFSSLACLESNMLKLGISTDPVSPEANLSPWYLGNHIGFNRPWYAFNAETIPDVTPPTTFGYYQAGYGWGGGGCFWTADYLISGKELPAWDNCPMPTERQTSHLTLSPPFIETTKKYNIAKMSLILANDFASAKDYRNRIKRYILENGAIQGFVHLEAIDFEGITGQMVNGIEYTGFRFMDKKNFNMYTYETKNLGSDFLTHAITIAGWDDNRIINVMGHTTTGAWLIKDSQSKTSWDDGYFWVAYDDPAINVFASGLEVCKEERYAHQSVYQTHPGILSKLEEENKINDVNSIEMGEYGYLLNGYLNETSWGIGEFFLGKGEILAGVGIFTSNRNQNVNVHIYKNDLKSEPLITKGFTLEDIGYHLIDLETEIQFLSSDTMIIAVGFEGSAEHSRLPLVYVQDENYDFMYCTYFGRLVDDVFRLTSYDKIDPKCAFFLQAIVLESLPAAVPAFTTHGLVLLAGLVVAGGMLAVRRACALHK